MTVHVLFVCLGNICRSPTAQGLFQSTALDRGYDISDLRARQVVRKDFEKFDYILAMDKDNLHHLLSLKPNDYSGSLGLFLDVAGIDKSQEVPDPYYGGQVQFDRAIKLIEDASDGLLKKIRQEHDL